MTLLDRRSAVLGGLAVAAGAGSATLCPSIGHSSAQDEAETLMTAPSLGESWIGRADAPVTMIEYASTACGHCADFHVNTFPELKREYIDSGKVRFSLREFPLDEASLAAFMLARCAPGGDYLGMVDVLFEKQASWAKDNPKVELLNIAKLAGFTQESFDTCMQNNTVANGILETRNHASLKLGVDATPTFFINGQKISGSKPVHYFQKLLDALLS